MKKITNYIQRNKSVICSKDNLEHLYTFKNFPVFMGCTKNSINEDLFADMVWEIDPESGFFSPTNVLITVDLPEPDLPTKPKISPDLRINDISLNLNLPYDVITLSDLR